MKPIAIYARVSTEAQEKQETIQSQVEVLKDFAKQNKYNIISEYLDNGYSGAMLNRPALDRLRDDATKGLFETVLIHSPDRLARTYAYQYLVKEELTRNRINILFINNPQKEETPESNLSEGLQGLIAQYEKIKIMERSRRGKIYKAKQGIIITNHAPYGYKYIPKDKINNVPGHFEIIESEALIVKKIFDLFTKDNKSLGGVARQLNKEGILPRKGKGWIPVVIRDILMNEIYIGITYYNKSRSIESNKILKNYSRRNHTISIPRPKEEWIPIKVADNLKIIDKDIFNFAQEQLKTNAKHRIRESKFQYLLKGFLVCGECGYHLVGSLNHKKTIYRCNGFRSLYKTNKCPNKYINANLVENLVWNSVCESLQNPEIMIRRATNYYKHLLIEKGLIEQGIKSMDVKIANLITHKNRVLDAYTEGILTKEDLKNQIEKIREKENFLNDEKGRFLQKSKSSISPTELRQNINNYCEQIKSKINDLTFEKKREILKLLIQKIIINKEGEITIQMFLPDDQKKPDLLHKQDKYIAYVINPKRYIDQEAELIEELV